MTDTTQDREAVEKVRSALHQALAPTWMSVAGALGGDQGQYEAMLRDLALAALTAAGWDETQAEVERLRGVERGWQHDRSEWEAERNAALARATSAEQERDDARQQVAGLRAGIYDAAARAEAETRFRADVSRPDTVERDRQVFQEGVWWARAVLRALAETGQPDVAKIGPDVDTSPGRVQSVDAPGEQVGETFRVEVRGRGYGKTQALAERAADAVERRGLPAEALPVPAPVVPDSAGVRERLLHVLDSHGIDTYIDGTGAEVGIQNLITDILAVVGQGVTAEQDGAALVAAERRRQVEAEGWTPEHDAAHPSDELATAAACYALPGWRRSHYGLPWPWDMQWWKPTPDDRVRELVKAGALIAAEIDRHRAVVRSGEQGGDRG